MTRLNTLLVTAIAALATTAPSTTAPPPSTTGPTTTPPSTTTEVPTPPSISVAPPSGTPGTKVAVTVACEDPKVGPVISDVLAVGELAANPDGHQPWALHADGVVRTGAVRGGHLVSVTCGGRTATTTFTVVPGQVRQVPRGPAQTGGGGTAS
ncbi:MAG: hypothetical protein JOZ47_20345 [Kutzneria sp.]|nr:hypothetical protein [Kutzneria sp.]